MSKYRLFQLIDVPKIMKNTHGKPIHIACIQKFIFLLEMHMLTWFLKVKVH